jgi:uncharacterized membrane protein YbhN (UPF0104 family)
MGRWPARVKPVLLALLAGGAAYELVARRHQLARGIGLLAHPRWPFLVGAVAVEAASVLALAGVEWVFLQPGQVRISTARMAELTAAHNAITMSVPGGVAWSTAFLFEQLRRRGATRTLAGWAILASGAVTSFCLFLLLATGIEWAPGGPTEAAKVPVALLAAIPPAAVVAILLLRARGMRYSDLVDWTTERLRRWSKARRWVLETARRLQRFQPTPAGWTWGFTLAFANWLLDLACLALSIAALSVRVPWPGILVAYALAKVLGMLPITPGGLGTVEAGLAGLLVVYGLSSPQAVGATLVYRLISFWLLLPVGWGYWAYFKVREPDRAAR